MADDPHRPVVARSPGRLRLLIVDDQPLSRSGLVHLLGDDREFEVVGEADTVARGRKLVGQLAPSALVTELGIGAEDGLQFIRWVATEHPAVRVIALTSRDAEVYAERALKAGALAFVTKREPLTAVLRAMRDVAAGRLHVPEEVAQRMLSARVTGMRPEVGIEALTDREMQIFELMGRGQCTHEIAKTLHLSEKTVACHRGHIKDKLQLERLNDLVRHAVLWVETHGGGAGPG